MLIKFWPKNMFKMFLFETDSLVAIFSVVIGRRERSTQKNDDADDCGRRNCHNVHLLYGSHSRNP